MEFKLLLDQALLKRAQGVVYIFPPTLPFLHVTLFMCYSYASICLLAFYFAIVANNRLLKYGRVMMLQQLHALNATLLDWLY